ncbi:PRC and DUF2382 domain-containing protein [Nonomuraea sp. NPDC050310]|uniref:PRC and DUF2382 domain-containing protein n=1 Tax=Nonomuraea sp. NPDC050310 TaxID=3154935 RepID=UPI0033F8E069
MISHTQIDNLIGMTVYDANGDRVGEVQNLYLDDESGRPEWMTVKTGWFGMHESFVPLSAATRVEDRVQVDFDKSRIKDAPRVDAAGGQHLSAEEERELYRYYGVNSGTGTSTTGRTGIPGQGGRDGVDMSRRGTAAAAASIPTQGSTTDDTGDLTLSEERLRVGTESYETGRVRLRKYVVTEQQQVTVPVTHEEVRVEREPIADGARGDVDFTEVEREVTLHAERPVVDTEAVPVERVRLVKENVTEQETVSGQVRKERLETDGALDTSDDDIDPRSS